MKKIIIINGHPQAGKDTFVKYVSEHCPIPVFNFSTILTMKKAAVSFFGWNGIKDEKGRKLLSDLKDAWSSYNDGPLNEIIDHIEKLQTGLFFCHIREPPEIAKLQRHYGSECITLFIDREMGDIISNHADQNVEDFDYDIVVSNHRGLKDLKNIAIAYANEWACGGNFRNEYSQN